MVELADTHPAITAARIPVGVLEGNPLDPLAVDHEEPGAPRTRRSELLLAPRADGLRRVPCRTQASPAPEGRDVEPVAATARHQRPLLLAKCARGWGRRVCRRAERLGQYPPTADQVAASG